MTLVNVVHIKSLKYIAYTHFSNTFLYTYNADYCVRRGESPSQNYTWSWMSPSVQWKTVQQDSLLCCWTWGWIHPSDTLAFMNIGSCNCCLLSCSTVHFLTYLLLRKERWRVWITRIHQTASYSILPTSRTQMMLLFWPSEGSTKHVRLPHPISLSTSLD